MYKYVERKYLKQNLNKRYSQQFEKTAVISDGNQFFFHVYEEKMMSDTPSFLGWVSAIISRLYKVRSKNIITVFLKT